MSDSANEDCINEKNNHGTRPGQWLFPRTAAATGVSIGAGLGSIFGNTDVLLFSGMALISASLFAIADELPKMNYAKGR